MAEAQPGSASNVVPERRCTEVPSEQRELSDRRMTVNRNDGSASCGS